MPRQSVVVLDRLKAANHLPSSVGLAAFLGLSLLATKPSDGSVTDCVLGFHEFSFFTCKDFEVLAFSI